MLKNYCNLPTVLTLIRLIISPLLLPILLVQFLPYNSLAINSILAALFLAFSFTDFLDGYLARKYNQASRLGGALDHIADKFLMYSTFIALLTVGKIYYFWVIIFIGRDFFVMGLRQIALEHGFTVSVGFVGKLKTAAQMLLVTFLILHLHQDDQAAVMWQVMQNTLLALSLVLTVLSAYFYYRNFAKQFDKKALHED